MKWLKKILHVVKIWLKVRRGFLLAPVLLLSGCATLWQDRTAEPREIGEMLDEAAGLAYDISDILSQAAAIAKAAAAAPVPTETPMPAETPETPMEWRIDVDRVDAVDGVIQFRTRGLTRPTGDGRNKDGGFEWIIARVHGHGFGRLLIMVMGGDRPASRIWLDGAFWNNVFQVPMLEPAAWRIDTVEGHLRIAIDGQEIWRSESGGHAVTHAVMMGYIFRESTGQWGQ